MYSIFETGDSVAASTKPSAFFMAAGVVLQYWFRPVWSVNAPTACFKVEYNGERNLFLRLILGYDL